MEANQLHQPERHWDSQSPPGIKLSSAHPRDRQQNPTGFTSALASAPPAWGFIWGLQVSLHLWLIHSASCQIKSFPPRSTCPLVLCCSPVFCGAAMPTYTAGCPGQWPNEPTALKTGVVKLPRYLQRGQSQLEPMAACSWLSMKLVKISTTNHHILRVNHLTCSPGHSGGLVLMFCLATQICHVCGWGLCPPWPPMQQMVCTVLMHGGCQAPCPMKAAATTQPALQSSTAPLVWGYWRGILAWPAWSCGKLLLACAVGAPATAPV